MDFRKFLTIGIAVGIAANVIDFVVQGNLLAGYYTQAPFRQDTNMAWMVIGDFVASLVNDDASAPNDAALAADDFPSDAPWAPRTFFAPT
jgi:hypothetical protein